MGTGDPRENDGMHIYDSGTLNMSGGWVTQLETFDNSTANVSGGYIGEQGLFHFARGSSTINVFDGGRFWGMSFSHLELYDSATLNIHGGEVDGKEATPEIYYSLAEAEKLAGNANAAAAAAQHALTLQPTHQPSRQLLEQLQAARRSQDAWLR